MTKEKLLSEAASVGRYQAALDLLDAGKTPAEAYATLMPASGAQKATIDAGWDKAYKAASPKRDSAA